MEEFDFKRTRIKACGITRLEDALTAVAFGVDGLGFIFSRKSLRYITPEQARDIIRHIPPFISTVGVFVDEEATVVDEIAQYCGLSLVQLHGDEAPAYCRKLSAQAIKAFRVGPDFDAEMLIPYKEIVRSYLLDTYHKDVAGGTGQTFDWNLIQNIETKVPIILAGGMNPDNIMAAIEQVGPYAVDVNSGVESAPGLKDAAKLQKFVAQVRKADSQAGPAAKA
jgi:phosphoribosylanthranilate isomerase